MTCERLKTLTTPKIFSGLYSPRPSYRAAARAGFRSDRRERIRPTLPAQPFRAAPRAPRMMRGEHTSLPHSWPRNVRGRSYSRRWSRWVRPLRFRSYGPLKVLCKLPDAAYQIAACDLKTIYLLINSLQITSWCRESSPFGRPATDYGVG